MTPAHLKLIHPIDAQTSLTNNRDVIMRDWAKKVRQEVPAATQLSEENLYDGMVVFLDTMARVISTNSDTPGGELYARENFEICRVHGKARASTPGYTLDQIIQEYRILRQIIWNALEADGILENRERTKLLESIDNGMTQAATEFTALLGFPWSRQYQEMQIELEELRNQRSQREYFMNALAHDLRTPLTAAKMRAELILKEQHLSELVSTMAANLVSDIERTDRMIKDLLDVSLLRAGERLPLHPHQSDLCLIIENTLQQLSEIYRDRFKLNKPPTVEGNWDPEAIRRILENLCTNAIKYGNIKTPVTVTLNSFPKNIELIVHNEGLPLSQSDKEMIFQPFSRTKKTRRSTQNSWGIGLTIVRGLAEAHGGWVEVQSDEKSGTTFRVILPHSGLKIVR